MPSEAPISRSSLLKTKLCGSIIRKVISPPSKPMHLYMSIFREPSHYWVIILNEIWIGKPCGLHQGFLNGKRFFEFFLMMLYWLDVISSARFALFVVLVLKETCNKCSSTSSGIVSLWGKYGSLRIWVFVSSLLVQYRTRVTQVGSFTIPLWKVFGRKEEQSPAMPPIPYTLKVWLSFMLCIRPNRKVLDVSECFTTPKVWFNNCLKPPTRICFFPT